MTGSRSDALPWGLAWRVSIGQIVAWGILYYAFTVVVGPMQAGTGWSRAFLNAGLSLGLLTWGICAFPAGVWIQRRGGRGIMTLASLLGGAALALMGVASDKATYLLAWVALGAAMAGLLYEAAFAVVTAHFGAQYRRGITLVTLVGGLASTAFIPLAQVAVDGLGWRAALVALGAFEALVCAPLHAFGIPRLACAPASNGGLGAWARAAAWWRELRRDLADRRFLGLSIWFTAHSAGFSGLIFQIVPILQNEGVPTATMLQAVALIGPMQVLGRLALAAWGEKADSLRLGAWAMGGLFASALILLALPTTLGWLALFAALYGASNGALTILRGAAVAEVFGRERYAELNGALALPAVVAKAAAPLVLAALWSATGSPRSVFLAVIALAAVAGIGIRVALAGEPASGRQRLRRT